MTAWQEGLETHPVHVTLKQVLEFLDGYAPPEDHTVEDQAAAKEAVFRATVVLQHVARVLQTTDPVFMSVQRLTRLRKQLGTIQSEFGEFDSDKNHVHLQNIHSSLDAALDTVFQVPPISTSEDAHRLAEAATAFRDHASKLIDGLRSKTEQTAIRAEQFEKALESAKAEVSAQKGRLDAAIAGFQSQFSEAEDRRRQSFEQSSQQLSEKSAQTLTDLASRADEAIEQWATRSSAAIETLEAKRREAVDLVHVIGNVGVTGNFKEVANEEKKAADMLRILALSCMGLIIIGVASTIWVAVQPGTPWPQIAIRIGITLALAIPATYAARESAEHRRVERATRRLELELASLDPYLEKLPEDQRNEVKKRLSERFFGTAASPTEHEEKHPSMSADVLKVMIKEFADLAKRAMDQVAKR